MNDKHQAALIERMLSELSAPLELMEAANCNVAFDGHQPVAADGWLYMPVRGSRYVVRCSEDAAGASDVLQLAVMLVATIAERSSHADDSFAVYRRALRGELTGSELEALSHEYQLPEDLRRCVLIFHIVQTDGESAYDLLRDITPMQDRDVLIDMDRHSVVLLKDMSEDDSIDELVQYAQALQETLMEETAHQMTIGVGGTRHTLEELRESYAEARKAIEVGRIFKPEESIYVYSRLILERFLTELPPDISAYYHALLFNRRNQRLFNDEMLYTIDMFFRKDLNLSDTARQLYIHRNTLVYRLDKVQKQTGLDLRSFEDAVTFKILMELKRVSGERGSHRKS
ncbi:MAG: helix-turn-helix domain-containing protein [Clostridia bacterium]|nr:helix-turn-helix domain-containing protein [Clostridia bacterium]